MNIKDLSSNLETAQQLAQLWSALIDGHLPAPRQFLLWLNMYELLVVEKGINRAAVFAQKRNAHASSQIWICSAMPPP